jgi:hypothetical protein
MRNREMDESEWNKLDPWWRQALDQSRVNPTAIHPNSPEFTAWMAYFANRMSKVPRFMLEAKQSGRPVTLPSPNPPDQ